METLPSLSNLSPRGTYNSGQIIKREKVFFKDLPITFTYQIALDGV